MGRILEFALTINAMMQGNLVLQANRATRNLAELESQSQRLRTEYTQQRNALEQVNLYLVKMLAMKSGYGQCMNRVQSALNAIPEP